MINKETVKKNFSKYARYYDRYCTIQNLCASRLISKIKKNGFDRILDIGCGTGNYTRLLRDEFPKARIKAIDISPEMIEVAKEKLQDRMIEFIVSDGEAIDLDEQFGLISSNVSFQWFEDLEKTLSRYEGLLDEKGVILFSIFGPFTFYELNKSLKELAGKDMGISAHNFFERTKIKKILKQFFKTTDAEQRIYKERYSSLSELLKKIKYTGARGDGVPGKGFWTPNMLKDLEDIYIKKYRDITATYQIFFCKGIKR